MKTFYARVTNVTNSTNLGLVGQDTDILDFKRRIEHIFPESDFVIDDMHQLGLLEVRVVHPDCKGVLDDCARTLMVESPKALII